MPKIKPEFTNPFDVTPLMLAQWAATLEPDFAAELKCGGRYLAVLSWDGAEPIEPPGATFVYGYSRHSVEHAIRQARLEAVGYRINTIRRTIGGS